jgi:hypothetical protein
VSEPAPERGPGEPPPILGRWGRLYALVIVELVLTIALLAWMTRRFS